MTKTPFEIETFSTKSAVALHDYMEPLLADHEFQPDVATANAMITMLSQYDHYHLVYALLVSFRVVPERIVPLLPQYLTHTEASVCATAINLLDNAPAHLLTDVLIDRIRQLRVVREDLRFLADVLARLEDRRRGRT